MRFKNPSLRSAAFISKSVGGKTAGVFSNARVVLWLTVIPSACRHARPKIPPAKATAPPFFMRRAHPLDKIAVVRGPLVRRIGTAIANQERHGGPRLTGHDRLAHYKARRVSSSN